MRLGRRWLMLTAVLGLIGHATAAGTPPASPSGWDVFLQQFEDGYFVLNPDFAVAQGRHEFDGRLPAWSPSALDRKISWLQSERASATAYDDNRLEPRQRFERQYLLARIDGDLFWIRDLREPYRNPKFYLDALDPSVYLTRPYAPPKERMRAFIGYLHAVPAALTQLKQNLHVPMPRTFASLGENSFGGYVSFFHDDAAKVFADVQDPELQAELRRSLDAAADAMKLTASWFHEEQARATNDFAIGPEAFSAMLRMTERVSVPLAQLQAIGQKDLDRNLASLKAACERIAPGATLQACVDHENADKASGGAVAGARAQLDDLKKFIQAKNLVTIPGDEVPLVDEAPPYARWNFAYINIAGPFDKGLPSTYYIAPPDPTWPESEQLAYTPGKNDLLFTSVHEVWPGHFLQFLHANRSPYPFGQLFVGYAFAEGWAHYSEEMMWDAGLGNGDPHVHVGQLTNALLRNVRFICAIGMHTGNMSPADCEALFKEKAFSNPGEARQQAARGTYDPAYLNYTLGKLMIRKLREDWTAKHGGKRAIKAFHDGFLQYGGPPIPLVREQMMGENAGNLF